MRHLTFLACAATVTLSSTCVSDEKTAAMPAEALQRRPGVVAAERVDAAQTASAVHEKVSVHFADLQPLVDGYSALPQ